MSKSQISDRDIERFFSRQLPEDDVLAELMPRLHDWHARHVRIPSNDQVKVFAVEASQIALASRPEQPTTAAATRAQSGRRLLRRLSYQLGVGLAALVLVSGMTGVAVASNEAAPGDALYGVDRALENIGINNGGAAERIAEAQVLLDRGQTADAVTHAAEAIAAEEGSEDSQSALALETVAAELRTNGSENSEAVHARVAAMLEWMAKAKANDGPKGKDFGQTVSNMARGIPVTPANISEDGGDVTPSGEKEANPNSAKPDKVEQDGNGNGNGNADGNGNGNGNGPPPDKPGNGKGRP